jgi:cbb3-type cytochrome oxidase maturation protein
MSILGILVPLSLVLVGIAVWAFFWAADGGQFDDLDSPALDAILDDEQRAEPAPRDPP